METFWSVRRPVGRIRPGDHAWLGYCGVEEHDHVVGAFVREGLLARDKVIYLCADAHPEIPGVVGRPPASLLTVLETGHDGPGPALAALAAEVAAAERAGFAAIRVTADLTCAARDPEAARDLLDCEAAVERLVRPSTAISAICRADRRRVPPETMARLRAAHAVHAAPDPDFEDAVLQIVRTFDPRGLALSGELDASRHTVLDQALALVLAGGDHGPVHLDLAELRFIDLGALNMLAEVAARRAGRGPLILDRMPSQLHEVITTVGWNMLPGLQVGCAATPDPLPRP
ncbi:MEDS domain-containing protein [Actinomadura atramentaria]|uniref:MEDS domain-containing protein n=1 Tax=Actinomadura atramentaria TaxID=1990 RepID=UPI00052673C0|nr:MEDS domain-containing protein [Actinomadura atramentaria]